MNLFVDTSVWYAAADAGDHSNAKATEVLSTDESLVTTDHVLIETWLLLNHRIGKDAAERFWHGLRTGVAHVEHVTVDDLNLAWLIGKDFPDQDFSVVDRTSFAVMQRLSLVRVASFDDDFVVFRYGQDRNRAFEVIR